MDAPDLMFWLDIETNQLEAPGGQLLEVAAYVTDTELNLLEEQGFHAIVHYSKEEVGVMRTTCHEKVRDMHDETGLWKKLPRAKLTVQQVDQYLSEYLKSMAPGHRQARMAGSSIRFDMNWTEQHLPTVYEHLHYRTIDVSTLKALMEWWQIPYQTTFDDSAVQHVAKDDILGSMRELEAIKQAMGALSVADLAIEPKL